MSKWQQTTLGEVCEVRRGTTITKKQTVEGTVPVIGGGRKPTYYHNESNREENCITVSGSGASAGLVNIWNEPIFASDCSTVEPKDLTQLSNFLYYYLCSKQDFIYKNFRSGAAQPHVYAKDIETIDYPLVPVSEQERIVAFLDEAFEAIDTAIANTEKNLSNTEELFMSFRKEIFKEITGRSKILPLGKVCENLDKYRVPITKSKREAGVIPYYGASGIVDYVAEYLFDEDLLLVSEDGANLIARTYPIAFSVEGKIWVNNHAHVLKFENTNQQEFVEHYLNSISLENWVSGMAQPKLNQKALASIPIPWPSNSDLFKLVTSQVIEMKNKSESIMEVNKSKLAALEELKQSVLEKAFSGELTDSVLEEAGV